MKHKLIITTIAFILLLAAVLSAGAQGIPEDYKGLWECGRTGIDMIRKDSGYIAMIHWGSSYAEHNTWIYTLAYDPEGDCLIADGNGVKSLTVFTSDGNEESYTEDYTDGSARFAINEAGLLTWEDLKEDAGNGMEFEKIDISGLMPTQEEFIEGWFHVVGSVHQGTAGSSLSMAQAAYKTYDFAQYHQLWGADIPTLRSVMLAAWESMSDEERAAFDANFIDVVRLINSCREDPALNLGVFADAGVPVDRMEYLLNDIAADASWDVLVSHTLTMGNSDSSAAADTGNLTVDILDDGSILLTVNNAEEGMEAITSMTIGEDFSAVDLITDLEGDSCLSVTLTNVETGIDEAVLIEAFTRTSHYHIPAGDYTVRFIVKTKATAGTILVRSCDGADGISAELAALLATDDEFPPFSTAYGEGGFEEAVSRAAANSVRDHFSDERQLVAAVPVKIFSDYQEETGTQLFSWAAVYALKADGDTLTAVGYSLAPVKMDLGLRDDFFYNVSNVRWGIDGEEAKADMEDMCKDYEGLAKSLWNARPTGKEADAAFLEVLHTYMEMHDLRFTKLSVYGADYDL